MGETHKHAEAIKHVTKQWANEEIKKKILNEGKWKWKHNGMRPLGCNKTSSKRGIYSDAGFPHEIRKVSNNITLHLKELEKVQSELKKGNRDYNGNKRQKQQKTIW